MENNIKFPLKERETGELFITLRMKLVELPVVCSTNLYNLTKCLTLIVCFIAVGVVGGGMPEAAGGERRHVPLYGRLVAEDQLASMSAPSDIQVSAAVRNPRAFCRYRIPIQVNDARGSLPGTIPRNLLGLTLGHSLLQRISYRFKLDNIYFGST